MFPDENQSRLVKELNLKFDSIIAEFKKEKEALIDINAKLHARVKKLEHEKKRFDYKISELEDTIRDLDTEIEDIYYQSKDNDARIDYKISDLEDTIRYLDTEIEDTDNRSKKNNARIAKLEQTQKSYN
ncbi:3368_t:CDS:1 [Entrophospora sp. SA101]|nr:3368_t:CDS:1 [Entrophospora sp. SA101]CAJ0845461.1 11829_t:CDS:1 [Entrophospora sp. SA101]CAJ0922261.1 6384_t:CDS:1 [Entrophospora sp. SA101]